MNTSRDGIRTGGAIIFSALLLCASAAHADVVISTKPTSNMTCSGGVCTPTAKKAVLNTADLANMLASGDTTVQSGSVAQDIDIDAKLSWAGTTKLTLDSYRSIAFEKPMIVTGTGALTISTNDGGSGGDFQFIKKGSIRFWDVSSNLIINGNRFALADSIPKIKDLVHKGRGERYIALSQDNDARNYTGGTLPFAPLIFEGLGNTISNLRIVDLTDNDNVGLFSEAGVVRDVGLLNVNIIGDGSSQAVGAIAGEVDTAILNSFVTGSVSANGSKSSAGGLADSSVGTIARSYSTATVSVVSGGIVAGGLVGGSNAGEQGEWNGKIEESYFSGTVTGGDGVIVGGLAGYNNGGAISNSYSTGSVNGGSGGFVGGLLGANVNSDSSNPTISASYSTGLVTGSNATVGGLIGEDLAQTGNASNYWDLDTSGISDPGQGAGNVQNDSGITGLSDAQFKAGLPVGFDKKVWSQTAALNSGYPYLLANPPPK